MFNIAFASGKGGAGKTSLSLSFHKYISNKSIYADTDVDASDGFLLLEKEMIYEEKFISGFSYSINQELCQNCGVCKRRCVFDAISKNKNQYHVDGLKCEGCGRCEDLCPARAIQREDNYCGNLYHSTTICGSQMVYAKLIPGEDNSGKLVNSVRQYSRKIVNNSEIPFVIIDSPPGIGCPTIASLTGINMLVLVIEASKSGFSDAKRLYELAKNMKIDVIGVINKSGLDKELDNRIINYLLENKISYMGSIPFNKKIVDGLNKSELLIDIEDKSIRKNIENIMEKINKKIEEK